MLKIRLQRIGKRGQAYFRIIVTEHTQKPKGRYLELLGTYNPHEDKVNVDKERVLSWLSKGAQASPTTHNLLVGRKVIEGKKVQAWKAKSKPLKSEVSELPKLKTEAVIPSKEIKEVMVEEVSVVETPAEQSIATP
ncbi:MAG: 30S ribosomal protein S16 [Candidatus Yanofskybacteria bacterium]|nr:30S ribosomal protein S16 [Candidatus Yanofskybacteria bacterium]